MEISSFQASGSPVSINSLFSEAKIRAWMISYVAEILEVDPSKVDVKVPFDRYGLDSSVAISLTNELEEWLKIELDPMLLYDYPTIDALVRHLTEKEDN
jgi:acyl carrier protein